MSKHESLCAECLEPTEQRGPAGDSLTWCESCQQLEPRTVEITEDELEAREHGKA